MSSLMMDVKVFCASFVRLCGRTIAFGAAEVRRLLPASLPPALLRAAEKGCPVQALCEHIAAQLPLKCEDVIDHASDCTGWSSASQALAFLGLPAEGVFFSEKKGHLREALPRTFQVERVHECIWSRLNDHLGDVAADTVALYEAGFPCQPFSRIGANLGTNDEQNGNVLEAILLYLQSALPRCWFLENVEGFTQGPHQATFEKLMADLRKIGNGHYQVRAKILCSSSFGLPQARRRVYIIGIRASDARRSRHVFK